MKLRFIFIALIFSIVFAVSIRAQQSNSVQIPVVYVLGNVIDAKKLSLAEPLTLTQAIEKCGGMKFKKVNFFKRAKSEARIYRLVPGSKDREEISIDFGKIMKGIIKDVILEPYDIIQVTCPKGKKCSNLFDFGLL